jgi:AcrR family transcriptional regulator
MRVTAVVKQRTRERILGAARRLFLRKGFEETTIRDIAQAARIAGGTMFNYFPNKESLAMTLVLSALEEGEADFEARHRGTESLEEDLFRLILTDLRCLEPYRTFLPAVTETALSPFTRSAASPQGEQWRIRHMERVRELLQTHGLAAEPSVVALHLYWTLYLGVLAFWAGDASPNREDTLVVLDQSLRLLVASLTGSAEGPAGRRRFAAADGIASRVNEMVSMESPT